MNSNEYNRNRMSHNITLVSQDKFLQGLTWDYLEIGVWTLKVLKYLWYCQLE